MQTLVYVSIAMLANLGYLRSEEVIQIEQQSGLVKQMVDLRNVKFSCA
jgi:hypothetical protein